MIDRRRFLASSAAVLLWPLARRAGAAGPGLAPGTLALLESSPFVYVSPLRADGSESTCHGEVWFAWLDESVVLSTASGTWKARSLAAGRRRARIWVGDHGRWKGMIRNNEAFRAAPHFDALAERVADPAVSDALLAAYDRKYPDEIGRWRDEMSRGFADGNRVVIRYTPV